MNFFESRLAKFVIDHLIDSSYCVAYRIGEENFWKETGSKFNVLKPAIRYWYADPIPFQLNGKFYVFMEKYDRFQQIGYIGASELKRNGRLTRPRTVIRAGTHMSFPMVLWYKQSCYMFPESSATNTIEIYRMEGSPYQWKHYHSIKINEKIVDIAGYAEKDSILLFAGIEDDRNPLLVRRQLIRLRNLDDLVRLEWEILYTDTKPSLTVRNGGNMIGNYRIAQESTETDYGMYLGLYKVDKMDENGIEETLISRKDVNDVQVRLNRFLYRKIGTHTYGRCDEHFEVIDLSLTRLSALPLIRKIRGIRK